MILQNLLSVISLQLHDPENKKLPGVKSLSKKLVGSPIIIGAMAGIAISAMEISVPKIIQQSLDTVGNLAPPMSLLLIGASLSLQLMRKYPRPALGAVTLKLITLPATGLLLFSLFHVPADLGYLPALILLYSPTATIAYVIAKEMHGNADFAVATISASTLSAITFMGWLTIVTVYAPKP